MSILWHFNSVLFFFGNLMDANESCWRCLSRQIIEKSVWIFKCFHWALRRRLCKKPGSQAARQAGRPSFQVKSGEYKWLCIHLLEHVIKIEFPNMAVQCGRFLYLCRTLSIYNRNLFEKRVREVETFGPLAMLPSDKLFERQGCDT